MSSFVGQAFCFEISLTVVSSACFLRRLPLVHEYSNQQTCLPQSELCCIPRAGHSELRRHQSEISTRNFKTKSFPLTKADIFEILIYEILLFIIKIDSEKFSFLSICSLVGCTLFFFTVLCVPICA